MTMAHLTFRGDPEQWRRFLDGCVQHGEDPNELVANFVRLKLKNWDKEAKRELATDERLLAPLRLLVAGALRASRSWGEIAFRLEAKGLAYALAGGGLILVDVSSGQRLCKASEVGPSYARLTKRYGRHPLDKRPLPFRRAA